MTTTTFVGGQTAGNRQFELYNEDEVRFFNSSTAGNATIYGVFYGNSNFYDNSNAGYSYIYNDFGSGTTFNGNSNASRSHINLTYGFLNFRDHSNAALASVNLGQSSAVFYDNSTAGRSSFNVGLGSEVAFLGNSSANNSTILLLGGNYMDSSTAYFSGKSTGGTAKITVAALGSLAFDGQSNPGSAAITSNALPPYIPGEEPYVGVVDFSGTTGPNNDHKITAGSIAGAGDFYLGSNQLTVGSLNSSTTVSGRIRDGGWLNGSATGGSLVKVGVGTLTLSGANTYTGGTTVRAGRLELASAQAAGTGAITFTTGAQILQLDAGALGAPGGTFGNVLANFDYGDILDLRGLTYAAGAKATLAGSTLTVTSGGKSESFTLSGNYAGRQFQVYNDGASGSALRLIPGTAPVQTATASRSSAESLVAASQNPLADAGAPIVLNDGLQETVLLQGSPQTVTGFRLNEDVLDLSRVLSESHMAASLIQGSPDYIGNVLSVKNVGEDATLLFNPAGNSAGSGRELAELHGVGAGVTLQGLISGHDLVLGPSPLNA